MTIHANEPLTMKHVERLAVKTLRKCKFQVTHDSVNEVMSTIWSAYTRYNDKKKTKLFSWLINCARCKIKSLRKKRNQKPLMLSLDNRLYSDDGGSCSWHDLLGETQFDRMELAEIIEYAKSDIFTTQQRQIFERLYVGGEEITAITADIGINRTTAYGLLASMMEKIRWRFSTN